MQINQTCQRLKQSFRYRNAFAMHAKNAVMQYRQLSYGSIWIE